MNDYKLSLTHIFHERISACEIYALVTTTYNQSFGAAHVAPCSRLTLSKPRSMAHVEARRADIS